VKKTFGEILKKRPDLFPKPLDQAAEKVWGFASEMGRHMREGRAPMVKDALLMVGLCASLAAYLTERDKQ
jgi:hypothetical protein